MYHGTVRSLPLAEQLRAAALAGCSSLTTGPREYLNWLMNGISTRDIRAMAADMDVRYDHLDPFVRWMPNWQPADPNIPLSALNYDEDDFFRMAEALEAVSFSVVAACPQGANSMNELIDSFGRLCQRSARYGLRCDLEFVAFFGGVPDLASAWQIVTAVNADNSGILFDFWHYNRGQADDALLKTIPGRWITGVQLSDATAQLPSGMTELEDTIFHRRVPGQGEFRVREIVAILREIGGLNNVGPEIFSAAFDELDAETIAAQCRDGVEWALAT